MESRMFSHSLLDFTSAVQHMKYSYLTLPSLIISAPTGYLLIFSVPCNFPQSQKESAFFSILLLQYTLTELEIYLRKFHVVESDGEESEILLPSVTWNEEIDDFVPAKSSRIVKKDQYRLLYLKVCIKWLISSFSLSQYQKCEDLGNVAYRSR